MKDTKEQYKEKYINDKYIIKRTLTYNGNKAMLVQNKYTKKYNLIVNGKVLFKEDSSDINCIV